MTIPPTRRTRANFARLRAAQCTLARRLGLALVALIAGVSTLPVTSIAHADTRDDFFSPVVTVNPACGAGQQHFPFVDLNLQASDYTYANGGQWCVRADWYITPPLDPNRYCEIFFYVPNGNATADITVGLFTPGPYRSYNSVQLLQQPLRSIP